MTKLNENVHSAFHNRLDSFSRINHVRYQGQLYLINGRYTAIIFLFRFNSTLVARDFKRDWTCYYNGRILVLVWWGVGGLGFRWCLKHVSGRAFVTVIFLFKFYLALVVCCLDVTVTKFWVAFYYGHIIVCVRCVFSRLWFDRSSEHVLEPLTVTVIFSFWIVMQTATKTCHWA